MGLLTQSIELLNTEFKNRTSLSAFGQRASALRLLADSLVVRRLFEDIFEKLRQSPRQIEETDFDFLGWADEARWRKPEKQQLEEGHAEDCNLTQQLAVCLRGDYGTRMGSMNNGLLEEFMEELMDVKEIELATDENIRAITETLKAIHHFKKTHKWGKDSYALFFHAIYDAHTKTADWKRNTKDCHEKWMSELVGEPDLEDLNQRRRELLLSSFDTGFLDHIKQKTHVPAKDDLCFCDIKDEMLMPDLNDTLKWVAAMKKVCPLKENMFLFNEYARLGQYIYDNNISQQTCSTFFRYLSLIELVQTEIGWLTHPETKPLDEDAAVNKFIDRVKLLACKAAEDNNTQRQISSRGRTDYYIYKVDAQGICCLMDELKNNHNSVVKAYLKDSTNEAADSIKYVAPFMGFLLDTHVFTPLKMPKKDFERVFRGVYGNNTSAVSKMSNTKPLEEAKKLFDTAENIIKTYSIP